MAKDFGAWPIPDARLPRVSFPVTLTAELSHVAQLRGGASPATRTGEALAGYRPPAGVPHPHWQLLLWQAQAFFWHPQEQVPQSQVPQQVAGVAFFKVSFFVVVMVGLPLFSSASCAFTGADGPAPKTLQSNIAVVGWVS